jgi:hypothetical protein
MSIVAVTPLHDVRGHVEYVSTGRGASRRQHHAGGTHRLAPGSYSDMPSDEFVSLAEQLARDHGRQVQALGYLIAWSSDELKVGDEDDLRLAGDYSYTLAKRMHPHSPVSVAVHADSAGQHVHAHFAVLSHDFQSGRALTAYRRHREVAALNDELAREQGMSVLEPAPKAALPGAVPFDDLLRGLITDALRDAQVRDWATFIAACENRGVEVLATEHTVMSEVRRNRQRGEVEVGVTYRALDTTGATKGRVRRRKGSSLGVEFTHDAIVKALTAHHAPAPTAVPAAVAHSRERADLVEILSGVLARGVFSMPGMPGYVRTALQIGVRVRRERQRAALVYSFSDEARGWAEHHLPSEFSYAAVTHRIAEVAELRAIAPEGTDEMPVSDVVEVLVRQLDDGNADAPLAPRRRRKRLPDLPPLAQRQADLNKHHQAVRDHDRELGG